MRIPVIDVPGKPGTKKLQANSGGSIKGMRLCAFDSSSIRPPVLFFIIYIYYIKFIRLHSCSG
jgi:hypothetical protein